MPRNNLPYTIGMEFESVISSRENVQALIADAGLGDRQIASITRDASVESPCLSIGEKTTVFMGSSTLRNYAGRRRSDRVMGYEVVTTPLSLKEMKVVIRKMINAQIKAGEIYSDRSSIHVHVGFPSGLIFKKMAALLGLKVEPLMFKIAGMGNNFRGASNHSAYCRPLVLPPAMCIDGSRKFAVPSVPKAIASYGEQEFWNHLGIEVTDRDRYIPTRYMGINLYSILMRGTLEYRFFNFCTVSKYVEAVASLCQFITELIIRLPEEEILNIRGLSIFEPNPDIAYFSLLDTLVELGRAYDLELQMSKRDIKSIYELISVTPQPIFEKVTTLSHITRPRFGLETALFRGLDVIDRAAPPGIVDIHTFGETSRCLLGE